MALALSEVSLACSVIGSVVGLRCHVALALSSWQHHWPAAEHAPAGPDTARLTARRTTVVLGHCTGALHWCTVDFCITCRVYHISSCALAVPTLFHGLHTLCGTEAASAQPSTAMEKYFKNTSKGVLECPSRQHGLPWRQLLGPGAASVSTLVSAAAAHAALLQLAPAALS